MINDEKIFAFLKRYDIIIPIPISRKRYKERGYNQSELIVRQLSKKCQIEFKKNVLYKTKNIIAQSKLNKIERENNIKNVYDINKKIVRYIKEKNIIILDDIYTTGSTVNECSKLLKKIGVRSIGIITLAKD